MRRKIKGRKGRKETGIAVILVAAIFGVMIWLAPWEKETHEAPKTPEVPKIRRLLDGVLVEQGKENPPIVGVMVENMEEAQPISGIADAQLVFEALTEANITRFLAYFVLDESGGKASPTAVGEALPPAIEIGPVRSARPYFLDWAAEFNTLFAHVGSSPAAYEMLRKRGVEGVYDLDQWYESKYYVQNNSRRRPHHLFTTTKLLEAAYEAISRGSPSERSQAQPHRFDSWRFKSDASPDLRGNVEDITIGYVAPYGVQWLYDKFANHYKRMQWGGVHKDVQGKEIIAKNIAVAFQNMRVLDEIGRKEFATLGQGKGLVFQDGRVVVGTWKKPGAKADALPPGRPSTRERMRFYDAQGVEVEFNAGVTWIEIVPEGYEVKY